MIRPMTLTLLLLLAAPVAMAAESGADRYNQVAAERHFLPAYARLAEATGRLHRRMQQQCATAPAGRDEALLGAYAEAFLAWQGVQHLRFGPIQVLSRDFRFQLWPDKRGSVGKHLRRLLAERDPSRLEPDTFAGGSAAVQGFGALERLLYPGSLPADDDAAWRCRVATAISANLARMAGDTLDEWRDGDEAHRVMFATASAGNAYYDDERELSAKLLNNLHTQLERLVDQKLARPLGETADRARPKRAEAWRSGLSLAAIRTNLEALRALYDLGFAPRIDDAGLRDRIAAAFGRALEGLAEIDRPLAAAVRDPEARARLEALAANVRELKRLVAGDLAGTLGLPLGFNSLDGD